MMKGVGQAVDNVDAIIYLVDGAKPVLDEANKKIMEQIVATGKKLLLVINKVDKIKKENILRIIEEYNKYIISIGGKFEDIVPISVYKKDGLETLVKCLENALPEGDYIFEEDEITDVTERELVEEYIREKALKYLDEEIPHGLSIQVEKMKDRVTENDNIVYDIEANIICKKSSHKGIIIGKDGEMLKRIGTSARRDIEKMLDARVNLKLWVKVRKDWDDNDSYLQQFKNKIS
jgi:GTP-binding protein Era